MSNRLKNPKVAGTGEGQQHVHPISAASHYAVSAQFWENRAKALQALVDQQDAVIRELQERLAVHEPTAQEDEPAAC